MDIQMMRNALRAVYTEPWRKKVDKMPDSQVIALYIKFKKERKIK